MFNDNVMIEQLSLLEIPTDSEQIKFDPPSKSYYYSAKSNNFPTMYLNNAALKTYFYSTDMVSMLSLDIDENFSYIFAMWFNSNRYTISIIDNNEMHSDETVNLRDTVKTGKFHDSEEEHFQNECFMGTPISWNLEVLLKEKLSKLKVFYDHQYYTDFLKR